MWRTVDREAAERAIGEFLRALGHDPEKNPELAATPARVAAAYADELLSGYGVDVEELVRDGAAEASSDSIVAITGLHVVTICPHHLMPALGSANVAYAPGGKVLGLGTLSRLVDAYSRRLTLQESIGDAVVDALMRYAGALGAYCEVELVHGCLSARGPCQTQARAVTAARRGTFAQSEGEAALALALGRTRAA